MGQDSLKKKSFIAIAWNAIGKMADMIIVFATSVVLSRILSPTEFGLLAMVTVFISLSTVFVHFGFHLALIQAEEVSQKDYSTIFYFNIIIGSILTCILFIAAPYIADFYEEPIIKNMARAMSFVYVVNSLVIIHKTRLEKELNYKLISEIRIIAIVISGSIGIFLALNGYGVWSLVVQYLTTASLTSALHWCFNSWRPNLIFSKESFMKYWKFGSNAFGASFVVTIGNQIDGLMVGKFFLQEKLGLYNRGKSLSQMITVLPDNLFLSPMFPVLSRLQNDREKLHSTLSKINSIIGVVFVPAFVFIIFVSRLLLEFAYGAKWLEADFFLKAFCTIGMIHIMMKPNNIILNTVGKSELPFRINLFFNIIRILVIFVLGLQDLRHLMFGLIGVKVFEFLCYCHFGMKEINGNSFYFLTKFSPYIIFGVSSCIIAHKTYAFLGNESTLLFLHLLYYAIVFSISYTLMIVLFKPKSYYFIFSEMKLLISKFWK